MPRKPWRRVQQRFRPARVLEFYASTEGGVILVNVSGAKEGCMGQPLPGSNEVRIAAYEGGPEELLHKSNGFVRECGTDEIGMLLAHVRPGDSGSVTPLRGVFAAGD